MNNQFRALASGVLSVAMVLTSFAPLTAFARNDSPQPTTPSITIDTVNQQSSTTDFSCQVNPLTGQITITGSGAGHSSDHVNHYHVSINWGDGHTDSGLGSFSPANGEHTNFTFTYTGSHTYSSNGTNSITVKLYHVQESGQDNQASATLALCIGPRTGTLNVIKHVVNDGGGTASASDFSLHVKADNADVQGSPAPGSESGIAYTLAAGSYTVSEDASANYTASYSGDCDASGNVSVTIGGSETCTVTNTYVPPAPSCNAEASQDVLSDTQTTFTGDDGSGSAVAVAPTTITSTYWTANIPSATWIWSKPAILDGTVDNTETFTRSFSIVGTPTGATLDIAADNFYSVSINGHDIDAGAGTATDNNFATATHYVIPASDLLSGTNTLTIVGKNKGDVSLSALNNPAGILYDLHITNNECVQPPPQTIKVHIFKYLDDGETLAQVPDDSNAPQFPMTATWKTANLNGGVSTSGNYALGYGHGGAAFKYAADTSPMDVPADYSTNEVTDGSVVVAPDAEVCPAGKYQLEGYKSGDSISAAQSASLTTSIPTFTDLTADKYVIVVNKACPNLPPPPQNTCVDPDSADASGQVAIGTSFEPTLQSFLTGAGYSLNAAADQTNTQQWDGTNNTVHFDASFIDKSALDPHTFGYYLNGDTSTFHPIFRDGADSLYLDVPLEPASSTQSITISNVSDVEFVMHDGASNKYFSTKTSENAGALQHALVYNPSSNEYVIAFEDLSLGDHDYNDLIVKLKVTGCENAPTCNPEASQTIVSDANTTDVTDAHPAVLLSVINPAWLQNLSEATAKWIWSDDPVVDSTVATTKVFSRTFNIVGTPTGGSVDIAADNHYILKVNGTEVANPAEPEHNYEASQNYDISSDLVSGANTVEVTVNNLAVPNSTPASNPAGVIFQVHVTNNECVQPPPTSANLHATKVVCDSEQYLPNWGAGNGPNITSSTASDFVAASNGHCHLQDGWSFQWAPPGTSNPGDNGTTAAGSPWTSFGPTVGGTITAHVPVDGSYVWAREVLQNGYVPFSYSQHNNDSNNVSAEMYCNTDHLHYDNYDRVDGLTAGQDYYCVAFNAPTGEQPPTDVCPNLQGNQATVPEGYHLNNDNQCVADSATLTIVKDAIGGDGTFNFSLIGATASTTNITTVEGAGSIDLPMNVGSTTVTESSQEGWNSNGVNCVYDNESVGVEVASGEEIHVDNGDHVTCTFTNTKQGTTSHADLSLTKSVDNQSPDVGQNVTYTITVHNGGPDTATNIVVSDSLPIGMTYVSDDGAGAYVSGTGTWSIQSLANGADAVLHITASVNSGTASEQIINAASINHDDAIDGNTDNNADTASLTVNGGQSIQTDVCPNISGNQETVPSGMHLDGGQCVNNGGGGGGGWFPPASLVSGGVSQGEVLGASCGLYLEKHIKFGSPKNDVDQVKKLQAFLNKWMGTKLPITGFYGPATLAAVNAFQQKYGDEILKPWGINSPTGLVYLSTLRQINLLECPDLSIQLPTLIPWSANPNAQ